MITLILALALNVTPTAPAPTAPAHVSPYAAWHERAQAFRPAPTPTLKPWPRKAAHPGSCYQIVVSDGDGGLHPRIVCVR